ncbi:hypothetical protein N0V88_004649 [Collariella sp. IMI 366227]|nr:hypothetical protein N0V88_004649 [Collariella sp. IMI 366227]
MSAKDNVMKALSEGHGSSRAHRATSTNKNVKYTNLATQVSYLHLIAITITACFLFRKKFDLSLFTIAKTLVHVTFFYYIIWGSWLYPFYFSPLRHIPTVSGFPLWGQFFSIITEECGVPQRRWHRSLGPVIRYYFPFGSERLSVASDEGIRHLTVKNPYNFPKPVRAKLWMIRILGDGVLLAENDAHVSQRKTLNPGFSIQAIRTFTPVFWDKALKMTTLQMSEIMSYQKNADDDGPVTLELLDWFNRCTLDIIGEAGFGFELSSLEHSGAAIRDAYRMVFNFDIMSRALHGLQAFFPSSKHLPAKMNNDMEMARGIITKKANEIIDGRLEKAEKALDNKNILTLIAKENRRLINAGEPGLSKEAMRDQVMTFLAAGHDTTATGVAWTIHLLASHPDIQHRTRAEIKEHMPFLFDPKWRADPVSPSLNELDPDQLPFLDNLCRESLRYIPPIPMTVRESVKDDVIDGYAVPAHTVIYMLANTINRMEWFWGDDADEFNPDRWNNLPATAVPNSFMTFLQGPRGCIGRKFAEVEMKVMLCILLSAFEFNINNKKVNPEDWKMWRLVLRPRDGVSVHVKPLEHMC